MGSDVHGQAWGVYGGYWVVMGPHGPLCGHGVSHGPSLYGVSSGVLRHVMKRVMGVACVHTSHLHSKRQHSITPLC